MPSSALISEGRLNRGHFWTWTIFPLLRGFWQAKMDTPKMNNIWKLTKHKWFKQGVSNLFQFAFQAPSKKTASNDRRLTWNKVLPLEKGSSTHKRLPPKRQTGPNFRKEHKTGQSTIIPKVEFRRFGGGFPYVGLSHHCECSEHSLTKPPFGRIPAAQVVIVCPHWIIPL